ncbi:AMP-dependent synthetase [Synergistales bacterium]|nr:AMP-dependent synthetase [Synergistales bacterium]
MSKPRIEEAITQNFVRAPTEPCLWWRGTWWSRCALDEMAAECEASLSKSGFGQGHRLALILPNSPLFLASCIAAWKLGGSVVPVNPHLNPSPVQYLKSVGVFAAVVKEDVGELAGLLNSSGISTAMSALSDALPVMERSDAEPDSNPDIAVLFHTPSYHGKTSTVPITHSNISVLLASVVKAIPSMNEDDVMLNAVPNYHSLGFIAGGTLPLAAGLPQVMLSSLISPKNALAAMRSSGVTIIPTTPAILGMLLDARGAAPMSKIKFIFCGGGELMSGVIDETKELFGVEPLEGYGLTEASSILAVTPSESEARHGSSGKVLPCFEAEVRAEDGTPLPPNSEGRLWIRGDAVAEGYYNSPDMTAERYKEGWFDTLDMVRMDEDGYITIVSPSSGVIMSGGVPVYPHEVEAVIKSCPGVEDAIVVGTPSGVRGESVRAFVALNHDARLTPGDIISYCRSKLPSRKAPRSVKIFHREHKQKRENSDLLSGA